MATPAPAPASSPASEPAPEPGAGAGGIQARHQAALDAGRFLIQHCAACGRHVYFPRQHCPHCGADALRFVAPDGRGTVHAVTTVRRKPEAGGDSSVCLVELDEGVRLMSRVEGLAPAAVAVGLRVRARVAQHEGHGLVLFMPLDLAAEAGAAVAAAVADEAVAAAAAGGAA